MAENIDYNEKVKDHFFNPRNVGEIKDADGVGTVGNPQCGDIMSIYIKVKDNKIADIKFKTFGCVPEHEEVVLNNGVWEKVSDTPKDLVNKSGNRVDIKKRYMRNYNGKLLNITPFVSPYNSFMLTPNHPVLAIKREWMGKTRKNRPGCNWLRIDKKELVDTNPYYVDAHNLSEGDYLVFTPLSFQKNEVTFSDDFLRLLGYYLSEGYSSAKESIAAFAFNKNEEEYINEVKSLIFKIIDKEAKVRIRKNVAEVYVCSRKLVRLLKQHGSSLARNKKMSEDIMELPPKKQWNIFLTYFNGDGNKYKRRSKDSETYRADTVSKTLAIQMQQILARNGIFASIRKIKKREHTFEGRIIRGVDQYHLSFKMNKKHHFVHAKDGCFLVPIKKIEEIEYIGNVYNFEVDSIEHSYLVKGFAVHNCAAAIATSSILTEIAKGKTLDEALKITRDDVANELGGLPAIKLHCSNLAADALRKAIEDYRNKKKK
ncbi:MAG: iron-sulfur cluster assembly scaffold protein [Thermoplasmatales archaeon]|nr:iron-sulfur cluster assembly scaffold protein [Thermoplasmatales archaeon]